MYEGFIADYPGKTCVLLAYRKILFSFILSTEKVTDGISTLSSSHVTAEFASNFWFELLGYPNMFT